jgi:hypothetical protein
MSSPNRWLVGLVILASASQVLSQQPSQKIVVEADAEKTGQANKGLIFFVNI